jgi:hypothetical protein
MWNITAVHTITAVCQVQLKCVAKFVRSISVFNIVTMVALIRTKQQETKKETSGKHQGNNLKELRLR